MNYCTLISFLAPSFLSTLRELNADSLTLGAEVRSQHIYIYISVYRYMLLSLFSCFPSMPLSMEITEIYARNRKEAERGPLQTYPWKPFPPPWYYVDHGALAFHGTCPLACPMQENLPSLTPSLKEYVISGAYAMRNICFFFRPRHGNISLRATLPAGHAMATHLGMDMHISSA